MAFQTENQVIRKSSRTPEQALERLDIPLAGNREQVREFMREHSNFVLVGETGSGKTTCLPPLLLELKEELGLKGKIAVTQPRRVAASSVCKRVSSMMGCQVGEQVGYQVRFEDHTSEGTDINFMTDGILLRKMQYDPLLEEYSIIMVDEAHERSLNIDLCLGLLKDCNKRRIAAGIVPIGIVVTSATIEKEKFANFFGDGSGKNAIEVPGKMFPVEVFYEADTPRSYDYTEGAADRVDKIIKSGDQGDVLIFMPGKQEIDDTIQKIKKQYEDDSDVEIIALHADIPPEDQDKIFKENGKRKVIVSTNIAETSITIPGVRHVVDSGLIKQTQFDVETGIEQLVLVPHAISGLEQRRGRGGRVAPGKCYRLFTEESMKDRLKYQVPEIQRSDLAHVILTMKTIGIEDIENFEFIDPPEKSAIKQAVETLTSLGAIDAAGNLTETGTLMAELGLEPRLGRMVVEASRRDCVDEISAIAAFLNGKRVFNRPKEREREADEAHSRFKNSESDFVTSLNVWRAYEEKGLSCNWNYGEMSQWTRENFLNGKALEEARKVRLELLKVLKRNKIYVNSSKGKEIDKEVVGKAVAAGLIGSLMEKYGRFTFVKNDGSKDDIFVHPSSSVFGSIGGEPLMVAAQLLTTVKDGREKTYASGCMIIKPEWIPEIAPQLVKEEVYERPKYNPKTDKVEKRMRQKLTGRSGRQLGFRDEIVEGDDAVEAFATALVEGRVENVPPELFVVLDENKSKVARLNNYWQKAAQRIKQW